LPRDRLAGVVQGVFDNGTTLFLAENDADGWILVLLPDLAIQRGKIELHFADEFRLKFAELQLDSHKAAQAAMKKQQIYEKLPAFNLQPVLAAHE